MSKQQQPQQQLLLQQQQDVQEDGTPPGSPLTVTDMQQQQEQVLRCSSPLSLQTTSPASLSQRPHQHHQLAPQQQGLAAAVPDYTLKSLPPPSPWEIDFVLPLFLSRYAHHGPSSTGCAGSDLSSSIEEIPALYSDWQETAAVRFRLMVHPISLPAAAAGASATAAARERRYLGAFVETARKPDFPEDWIFQQGCRFYIFAVHPQDFRKSVYKTDTFHFSSEDADRGWHQFVSHQELLEERFLAGCIDTSAAPGTLYLRAGCSPICAAVSRRIRTPCPPAPLPAAATGDPAAAAGATQADGKRQQQGGEETPPPAASNAGVLAAPAGTPPAAAPAGMGRCGRGFVGLRNHGATCYMNALLQSLYFIGRFRQAVYALSFDTRSTSGPRSVDILERRRCRRKRCRAFAAAGGLHAKRGEAPGAAAAAAAQQQLGKAPGQTKMAQHPVGSCNGAAAVSTSLAEGQMDIEEASCTLGAAAGAAAAGDPAAAAAGGFSEESTDSEDELSDLDESDLRDLLIEEEAERRSPPSISLALQNLFLRLYTANEAVPYKELIRSFGWDAADAFTQQDTHELLKLLLDKVEEQMQRTPAEGSVKSMFEGEMETYVECLHVRYKSVRKEAFEDINLDVQGCSGVRESLKRLVMPELLEGDNAYDAEQFGKQMARKGVRFVRFPPVCVFLLKRFDFDFVRMDTVKVFDRYEFERELDLSEFCEGAGVYELHSVSVHQGDVNSGHYYSFLRPPPGTQWVRFDDDKVYHVSEYAAIGDNFGGEEIECYNYLKGERKPRSRSKPYNAYILVYVNKSQAPHLLADSNPLKVNPQILSRCRTEEQLRRLRTRIRNVLEKSVRVKVYHPLQFKYRRFLELPYLSIPPLLEFKRSRDSNILQLHEVISQELTRMLYGCSAALRPGAAAAQSSSNTSGDELSISSNPPAGGGSSKVQFVLHMINTSVESPRFEAVELSPNAFLGDILRRKGGGGGSGLEASLYVLAVPERPGLFSNALQHDELLRSHCLLFIKYFPSLTRTARTAQQQQSALTKGAISAAAGTSLFSQPVQHQQHHLHVQVGGSGGAVVVDEGSATQRELVICLDVISVPFEWKVRDLEPHVYRLIHQGITDGVIDECPSRAAEIARLVSTFPASLPPVSFCAPYPSPLPVPLKTDSSSQQPLGFVYGASVAPAAAAALVSAIPAAANGLQLTACLELDSTDKIQTNRLLPRKTLRSSKVFSGDLLVFSLDLPSSLLDFKEQQQKIGGRAEDLSPQQSFDPSSPADEGHAVLEAQAALQAAQCQTPTPAAAITASTGAGGDGLTCSSIVPWAGDPGREVRGLSLLPFVPRARGGAIPASPPLLPRYICNDFVDYCLEKQTTEIYHVRLYDPYEFLSKVMSSSGSVLKSPSLGCETSSLISEPSLVSLCGSVSGVSSATAAVAAGGASAVAAAATERDSACGERNPASQQHPSAGDMMPSSMVDLSPDLRSKLEERDDDAAAASAPSPIAEDPWLHMPRAQPICIKEFSLSGRLPVRQALRWIAWHLGVEVCRLLVFPEPPLLSDRKVIPLDIDAFIVTSDGHWEGTSGSQRPAAAENRAAADSSSLSAAGTPAAAAAAHQQQAAAALAAGAAATAATPGRRQMTLDEAYVQLLAAQSWPGSQERRRVLAAATPNGRLPRELHLCLLPYHYRLCSRTVNALQLHSQQQQQLQQLLLSPLPPAALSPSSAPPASIVLNYICLLFSRQAERIGCITGVLAAKTAEGRPSTAADLISDVLARLTPALAETLREDYRNSLLRNSGGGATSQGSSSSSTNPTPGSSSCSTATATGSTTGCPSAAPTTPADPSKSPDKASYESEFGPLRLFMSDASHLLRIPFGEQLTWLSLYAPASHSRSRDSVSNLLAVPLRLEADYSPEEHELIRSGARQVLLVQHQTPGEREPFGYPFELLVEPDATLSEIKAQIIQKLRLPKNAWGSCTFFQLGDGVRCWKGPNDTLDWAKHRTLTLIAEHSAPYTKHRGHGGMRIA